MVDKIVMYGTGIVSGIAGRGTMMVVKEALSSINPESINSVKKVAVEAGKGAIGLAAGRIVVREVKGEIKDTISGIKEIKKTIKDKTKKKETVETPENVIGVNEVEVVQ